EVSRAADSAGRSSATSSAMMAMTTSSSMRVNARRLGAREYIMGTSFFAECVRPPVQRTNGIEGLPGPRGLLVSTTTQHERAAQAEQRQARRLGDHTVVNDEVVDRAGGAAKGIAKIGEVV